MNTPIEKDSHYKFFQNGIYEFVHDDEFKRVDLKADMLRRDDEWAYIVSNPFSPSIYYVNKKQFHSYINGKYSHAFRQSLEIIAPTKFNQRLTFDIDIKKVMNKETTSEDIKPIFSIISKLCEALEVDCAMYGYGVLSNDEINELNEFDLKIYYEQKTQFEKFLSLHVITGAVFTNEILHENLYSSNIYLKHGNDKFEIDGSIYKNNHQLLRLPICNKFKQGSHEIENKSIFVPDDEEAGIFVSTTEEAHNDKIDILMKFIESKPSQNVKSFIKFHKQKDNNEKEDDEEDDAENEARLYGKIGLLRKSGQFVLPVDEFKKIFTKYFKAGPTNKILFNKGDKQLKNLFGLISHSPYTYETLCSIIYPWFMSHPHSNPAGAENAVIDFIDKNYSHDIKSNLYFMKLIDNIRPTLDEYIIEHIDDKDKNEYIDYLSFKYVKNNQLSKNKREIKRKWSDYESEQTHEYEDNESEKISKYNELLHNFTLRRIASNNGVIRDDFRTLFYIDDNEGRRTTYINPEGEHQSNINMRNVELTFKNYNQEELIITTYKEILELRYAYNLDRVDAEVAPEDEKAAKRFLKHFKTTFINESDYKFYIDLFRHKLNNPMKKYKKNMACFYGSDSMKTAFPQLFEKFLHVSSLSIDTETEFNEWKKIAKFLLIDEVPVNVKNPDKSRKLLKELSDYRGSLRVKNQPNIGEITHNYDILLNTNHESFGGVFYGQTEKEMFKRFHIIERKAFDCGIDKANKLLHRDDEEKHRRVVNAIVKLIKNMKPLTNDEIHECEKTQDVFIKKFKERTEARACLSIPCVFSKTYGIIRKDKNGTLFLTYSQLKKNLENENFHTSDETEKKFLESKGIIKILKNRTIKILNVEKLAEIYVRVEADEDLETINNEIKSLTE